MLNIATPEWLKTLIERVPDLISSDLSRHEVPDESTREAAVLVLFGPRDNFGEVVIIERASHLKAHPGQPAFPGGRVEEGDSSLAQTALREAREEIGLDPNSVEVLGELPQLWIHVSDRRLEFFLGGLNAKEFDQSCDASGGIFRKLGEVDAKNWNLRVGLDEPFTMIQQ